MWRRSSPFAFLIQELRDRDALCPNRLGAADGAGTGREAHKPRLCQSLESRANGPPCPQWSHNRNRVPPIRKDDLLAPFDCLDEGREVLVGIA